MGPAELLTFLRNEVSACSPLLRSPLLVPGLRSLVDSVVGVFIANLKDNTNEQKVFSLIPPWPFLAASLAGDASYENPLFPTLCGV